MTGSLMDILSRGVVDAEAGGNNRNRKRKKRGKNGGVQQQIQARCVSQISACEARAATFCGDNAGCAATIRACCQSLATCEFGAFLTCANAVLAPGN